MPNYYFVEKCRTRNIYFTFLLCLPSSLHLKICSAMTFDKDVAAPLQKTHSLPNKLSAMIQGERMMTVSDIHPFLFNLSLSRDSYCPEANFWIIGNLLNRFQSEAGLWVPWQDRSISFAQSGSQESHYVKLLSFFLLNPAPSHKLKIYRRCFI